MMKIIVAVWMLATATYTVVKGHEGTDSHGNHVVISDTVIVDFQPEGK